MLQLPNLFAPEGMKQLLPSWQYCKAYLSASASWTKAAAMFLRASAATGGQHATGVLRYVMEQLGRLHLEIWQQGCGSIEIVSAGGLVLVGGGKGGAYEYAATPSSIQLLRLVGLGTVIAVTAQTLAGVSLAASSSSGSSSEIGSAAGPSSSGSSHDDGVPGSLPRHVMLIDTQRSASPSTFLAMLSSLKDVNNPPLVKAVHLGLMHFNCLAFWSKNVYQALSAAAAAAKAEGVKGSSDTAADAVPSARAKVADQQQYVPKRLAKMPQQGLPAAVVEQMDRISSSWPLKVLVELHLPYEEAKQKQLLQDLLLLGHVLMVEVPSPVGCNNPGCLNLRGSSEAETAAKACGGCKVARYCSQECQRGHWKVHRPTCERLQQELKGPKLMNPS
jgi:hypothetical protein